MLILLFLPLFLLTGWAAESNWYRSRFHQDYFPDAVSRLRARINGIGWMVWLICAD